MAPPLIKEIGAHEGKKRGAFSSSKKSSVKKTGRKRRGIFHLERKGEKKRHTYNSLIGQVSPTHEKDEGPYYFIIGGKGPNKVSFTV